MSADDGELGELVTTTQEARRIDRSSHPNPYDTVRIVPLLDSICYPPQQTIFRTSDNETAKLPPLKQFLLSILTNPAAHSWEGDVFDPTYFSSLALSLLFTSNGDNDMQLHEFPWKNMNQANNTLARQYLCGKIVEHAEGILRDMMESPWYYYSSTFGAQTFSQPIAPIKEAQNDRSTLRGLVTICFDPEAPTEDEATNFLLQYGPNIKVATMLQTTVSHLKKAIPTKSSRTIRYRRG